jgi:hypothetical protein
VGNLKKAAVNFTNSNPVRSALAGKESGDPFRPLEGVSHEEAEKYLRKKDTDEGFWKGMDELKAKDMDTWKKKVAYKYRAAGMTDNSLGANTKMVLKAKADEEIRDKKMKSAKADMTNRYNVVLEP